MNKMISLDDLPRKEEITLSKLDQQLDDAEATQPLIQFMQRRTKARDENLRKSKPIL